VPPDTTLSYDDVLRIAVGAGLGYADAVNLFTALNTSVSSATVVNVVTYGAAGDGVTDDRAAIQAALDACSTGGGGEVWVPNGTYILGQGAGFFNLNIPANVTIRGESRAGTVLKQAAATGASVRLFIAQGADSRITNMTLDGNKDNNTAFPADLGAEHRHGVFADGCTRLVLDHVTFTNFTGDGFFLYTNATDTLVIDCLSTGNERNGMTFGGAGCSGTTIIGGQFGGNNIQSIDAEPGGTVERVRIFGTRIYAPVTDDFGLAISGFSAAVRARDWLLSGCTIDAPINVVWAEDITFAGCSGVNTSTTLPSMRVYRSCSRVTLADCNFHTTANASGAPATITVIGTGSGDAPDLITINGGTIRNSRAGSYGVLISCGLSVDINGTVIEGGATGAGAGSGVYARSTTALAHIRNVSVNKCTIRNFGTAGVEFLGTSGTEQILSASVTNTTFDSTVAAAMPNGILWNETSAPTNAVQKATSIGNRRIGNVTTLHGSYPTCPILVGGSEDAGAIYSCTGTPEGAIVAPVGSQALRRDGEAATTLYVKTANTTSAGWTAK
jgi:hypothetical protein